MSTKKLSALFLSVLFLGSNFLTSCSNETDNSSKLESNELLLKNLKNFNDSTKFENLKCDGFWDCLGDVVEVAGADIIGGVAAAGGVQQVAATAGAVTSGTGWVIVTGAAGVIGGAGASVTVARAIAPKKEEKDTKSANVTITLPNTFNGLSNVGKDHNLVVTNIYNGYNNSRYYTYRNISQQNINILESAKMKSIYMDIESMSKNYLDSGFNYSAFTTGCVSKNIMTTNTKAVLDLFLQKYLTCSTYADIETTVKFYINEVDRSNLSLNEKLCLISGFMIAVESPAQWLN